MKVNMKKWMMTLSMCFVAAATAMSVSAVTPSVVGGAEVPVEYIWVGNVKIEDGQYLKAGETSASFEAQTDNYAHYENDVLTLKNYTYTGEGAYDVGGYETYDAIHCSKALTINLEGTNVISLQDNALSALSYGLSVNGNLQINSASNNTSLTISGATGDALSVIGDISISNVQLALSALENGLNADGALAIENASLTVNSGKTGVACTDLTQNGGTMDVTADGIGVKASGAINIQAGKFLSRTLGTESIAKCAAIGSSATGFTYDNDKLVLTVSNDASGKPTEQLTAGIPCTYRYVLVIAKELAPKPSYSVEFDVNGLGVEVPKQSIEQGGKVTKPQTPVVENYEFVAWYKDASCTELWNFDKDTVTANMTLYAKWTESAALHVHDFGTDWHSDGENHWTECLCGEKSNVEAHMFYDEGKCVVCGVQAPAAVEEGKSIIKTIIKIAVIGGIVVVAGGALLFVGIIILSKLQKSGKSKTEEETDSTTMTTIEPTVIQPTVIQPTVIQPTVIQPTVIQPTPIERVDEPGVEEDSTEETTSEPESDENK